MNEQSENVTRVMVPVWTDAWMSGDQYGTVRHVYPARPGCDYSVTSVRMDKSGRVLRFRTEDLTRIGGW